MCGITGIFNFEKNKHLDFQKLKNMTNIIRHRGPDDDGFYVNRNIGLGHRRLSILDLNTGGQPMFNEDRSIVIIFNGEIFNYLELKAELIKLGHCFRTNSDTEVIIKAYQEWGYECQNKFNGMWAFAIWDDKKQQLFLSRDRIGEKPLIYAMFENSLIFSSEIKSLFEYGIPCEIRTELIEIYLTTSSIPGSNTFYKNIFKLKPGHFIVANPNGIKEIKYWDLPELDEEKMLNNKISIYDEFEYLFEDSVKIRMRSDVSFGAFLSGGLDSSAIVSLMSKFSDKPINTFTIGFLENEFDESLLAKLVSDKFKTNHHLEFVKYSVINDSINNNTFHFDEPFGDSAAISSNLLSNFAAQKFKSVLQGDGGDEFLSGYNSYAGIKFSTLYNKMPSCLSKGMPTALNFISQPFNGKIKYKLNRISDILTTSNYDFTERIILKQAPIPIQIIKHITSNLTDVIDIKDYIHDLNSKNPYKDNFYRLMHHHIKNTLPDTYLVKVDRMSMANSIETRSPFLDYRLVDFMSKVDKNIKMQGWELKSILKNTSAKYLQKQIVK